jgi:serine/threonine protein kinase
MARGAPEQPHNKHSLWLVIPRIVVESPAHLIPDHLLEETADAISSLQGPQRILGTLEYMAPEQIMCRNDEMGIVSDVWAFGIMLFEALTGRHPLLEPQVRRTQEQIADRVLNRDIPSPQAFAANVPERLEELVMRMLEKNPQ